METTKSTLTIEHEAGYELLGFGPVPPTYTTHAVGSDGKIHPIERILGLGALHYFWFRRVEKIRSWTRDEAWNAIAVENRIRHIDSGGFGVMVGLRPSALFGFVVIVESAGGGCLNSYTADELRKCFVRENGDPCGVKS